MGGGSHREYVMRPRGAVIAGLATTDVLECGGSHDLSFQHSQVPTQSPLAGSGSLSSDHYQTLRGMISETLKVACLYDLAL